MKIRRIRVLLAKGWCKVVCFVSFLIFSFVCNHVSAQKVIDMSSYKEPDSLLTVDDVLQGKVAGFENPKSTTIWGRQGYWGVIEIMTKEQYRKYRKEGKLEDDWELLR